MRKVLTASALAFTFLLVLQFSSAHASNEVMAVSGTLVVQGATQTSGNATIRVFTIIVGSSGFNGSQSPISIQVNQGDNVTIKFLYGDEGLSFDNPHQIKIEGYGIQTGKIDRETPVQQVTFTAGQVGSFQFSCVIPCFGMENVQNGSIVVNANVQGAPLRTNISQMKVQGQGDAVRISALLTDENGDPVSGAIVSFSVSTDFGPVNLGQNVTSSDGTVKFVGPLGMPREITITAHFAGGGHYLESKATAVFTPPVAQPSGISVLINPELEYPSARPSLTTPYLSGQYATVDLRLVGVQPVHAAVVVTVGLLVVVSVWSVYVAVAKEISAVWKAGKTPEENS